MAGKKKERDVRFAKFGTVSFTQTTMVNDFIDRLAAGKVSGTVCNQCGRKFFPPRAHCYECLDSTVDWFEVAGTGKLVTFSELKYAPIGFGDDLPYAIAVLDYGDYKVFGRIGKVPLEDLKLGMELKTEVNRLQSGQLNYVFNRP